MLFRLRLRLHPAADFATAGLGPEFDPGEDFAALLDAEFSTKGEVQEGQIVKGRIVAVGSEMVTVDVGYKSEAQIPRWEFGATPPAVGDDVEVLVEDLESANEDRLLVVSKEKADRLKVWETISQKAENDEVITGIIVSRVKGGLSVDIGVKAFLPGSQVDLRPVRNLESMIGKEYKFKVIKFNKKRGNIVLSRRVLLEKEREELKTKTLENLREGATLTGIVKNITDYGAFIDLGGIDGLLHITDMSWGRVNHPSELFHVGDEVQVKVLKFDPKTERVSLGMKQISEDPWKNVGDRYPVGTHLKGRVVSITDYGAFIELEEGVEGLVHISEMTWNKRIKHPSKLVAVGDLVESVVLDINTNDKRISLGMKQIEPNPWLQLAEKYAPGTRIQGKVRNITDFGIFVGIEEGIDGLVHISDLSWTQRVKHPSELYKKGDDVEAVVLNVDPENERFSLGIKQITTDPWTRISNEFRPGRVVHGRVMRIADFGAFVEIEPGVEGLLHNSEVNDMGEDASKVLTEGQEIDVAILDVDPRDRKISLSLKAASGGGQDYASYAAAAPSEASTSLGAAFAAAGFLPKKDDKADDKTDE
jgi:small subunit ribosomal protein S1